MPPKNDDFRRRIDEVRLGTALPMELMEPTELHALQARGSQRAALELGDRRRSLRSLLGFILDEVDGWMDSHDMDANEIEPPSMNALARMTVGETLDAYDLMHNAEDILNEYAKRLLATSRWHPRGRYGTYMRDPDFTLVQAMGLDVFDEDDDDYDDDAGGGLEDMMDYLRSDASTDVPPSPEPTSPTDFVRRDRPVAHPTTQETLDELEARPSFPVSETSATPYIPLARPRTSFPFSETSATPDIPLAPPRTGRDAAREAERLANDASADASGRRYERCIICWDRPPIYAPRCGHLCLCGTCANETIRRRAPCPVCRGPVTSDELRRTFAFGRR